MSEQHLAATVDQKIAAGLINIFLAIVMLRQTLAIELQINFKRCRREYPKPREPFQREGLKEFSIRIGEHREWPLMDFLIGRQLAGLGEGNNNHRDTAAIELRLESSHLTEVSLARQSSQVAQKNQQCTIVEMTTELAVTAIQVEQRKLINADVFHALERDLYLKPNLFGICWTKKRGAPT